MTRFFALNFFACCLQRLQYTAEQPKAQGAATVMQGDVPITRLAAEGRAWRACGPRRPPTRPGRGADPAPAGLRGARAAFMGELWSFPTERGHHARQSAILIAAKGAPPPHLHSGFPGGTPLAAT